MEIGLLRTFDLVSVSIGKSAYLSTAGRIIFNALINGFTNEPFKNSLGIAGIEDKNTYHELKYDGIITSGKVKNDKLLYYNLQDICKDLYLAYPDNCVEFYQNLTEFGFKYSDKFSVSLSIDDMDIASNKDEMLAKAEKLKTAIESDYQDGLISDEDRKNAIITLYNDSNNGVHEIVQRDVISRLDRNCNLFIMLDSGARGSAGQIMRMCGFLPQLQKDKQTTLETPITSNFYKGLSDFDVHMTSYSVRIGLASTQNETPKAGYATHKVVFMTSGVEIVEDDCGKTDWGFDILWGERLAEKDRFLPSFEWFNQNLLGKIIAFDDSEARYLFGTGNNGVIEKAAYMRLSLQHGFHTVKFEDGTVYTASMDDLLNKVLLKSDYHCMRIIGRMLNHGHITSDCLKALEKHHLREVNTFDGHFYFWYRIDECCKNMLMHRVVRSGSLPYTDTIRDNKGCTSEIITKETLTYIEDNGISRIEARVLLNCLSKHGICAKCYGLKYSNLKFPAIGECVGTEAAQAIGEPSAQLTISLVNKGGIAGAAINSGVATFNSLLQGSLPGGKSVKEKSSAVIAPRSGYVHIKKIDDSVVVSIEPVNKHCDMCIDCNSDILSGISEQKVQQFCHERIMNCNAKCQFEFRINGSNVIPLDNEWINAGDPVTDLFIMPDSVSCVGVETENHDVLDSYNNSVVYRKKQMVWLLNYFNTFMENNILINARHFEILARIQNEYVTVTSSTDPNFKIGETYEISEVYPYEDEVRYKMSTSKRDEVIIRTSGPMTALAFERLTDIAASLVNKCYKGSNRHNNALIGALSIGSNLVTRELKVFQQPTISHVSLENENSKLAADDLVVFEETVKDNASLEDISMSLGDMDLSSLDAALQKLSTFSENTSSVIADTNENTIIPSTNTDDLDLDENDSGVDSNAAAKKLIAF